MADKQSKLDESELRVIFIALDVHYQNLTKLGLLGEAELAETRTQMVNISKKLDLQNVKIAIKAAKKARA